MLINIPKQKKKPKPIKRIGSRGKADQAERTASVLWYLINREPICQLCGGPLSFGAVDFAHKKRASQGGGSNTENGLALHRTCHSFSHSYRDIEDALKKSPINMQTGGIVELSPQLKLDCFRRLSSLS